MTFATMDASHLARVVAIEQVVHAHPWTHGNFADSLQAGYQCWVVHRAGALVGYGVAAVQAGEAHLLNLSVEPASQRQGIGSALTRFFVALAREGGAGKLFLEVRPSNTAARALYAGQGFREVGVRRGYYPGPGAREDALVMELDLSCASAR